MELKPYKAEDLYGWVTREGHDFLLLDVRNNEEFGRFKVEGPFLKKTINVPYMEFIEHEDQSVAQVPRNEKIRIVCAKEGSAKFVGEILANHGWEDVAYLAAGIKSWGNMLAPRLITDSNGYALYQFIRPGKASCSYGLLFQGEMALFDPSRNVDFYEQFAADHDSKIVKSFETHLQADYISGSQHLSESTGAVIIGHEHDFQGAAFAYTPVTDGDTFTFSQTGGPEIKAVHMPGHTPGSTSYLIDNRYLVTGDAIFVLSIGRPDLGGKAVAWSKMLFQTLSTKIANLDDDVVILPGHYMDWKELNADGVFADSMGNIRKRNAEIYDIQDESEFIQFIKDNMRTQPEVYAEIRKVNAGLVQVDEDEQNIMDLGKNECAASMAAA
jgi:glyoxylase-like metal-dependent hydrolase (beta-lactamase superfamily II)